MTDTNTTPATPQLGIHDLANVVKIIDVASQRGAFRGDELSSVGSVRDRVATIVKAAMPEETTEDKAETPKEETKA